MNSDEALRVFVKENLSFLTSGDFDKKEYKNRIRRFFVERHNSKYGRPNQTDVCRDIVRLQIKGKIKKDDILAQIETFPIYKDIGNAKQQELRNIVQSEYESGLTEKELNQITTVGAYEAVKNIVRSDIEDKILFDNAELVEENKKIEEEIRLRREEAKQIPSILDTETIVEPDFNPEFENKKEWWERFYLRSNPFPRGVDGLRDMDSNLYDQIVVKSAPYENTLSKLSKDPDYLFDTAHLLVGDFGFGKTTFQDYLSFYLITLNILPIRITAIRTFIDSNGYLNNFLMNLKNALFKEANLKISEWIGYPDEEIIIEAAKEICTKYRGIVIFMDDYHKHTSQYDAVYEFLGNLQPLKDTLSRTKNCKVGFIVSGTTKWKRELQENEQVLGFFDATPIEMPPATAELIESIFNKRIHAYSYDTKPRTIRTSFIQAIIKETGGKGSYRNYLKKIVSELEQNNDAIVNTPIEIPESTLAEIKKTITSNSIVGSCLNNLLYKSRFHKFSANQIDKCLEILVSIYSKQYVYESEKYFTDNIFYINKLSELYLIQRYKHNGPEKIRWGLSRKLTEVLEEVESKYQLKLPDYFLKIFSSHGNKHVMQYEKPRAMESAEIGNFKKYLQESKSKIPTPAYQNIEEAFKLFDRAEVPPTIKDKRDGAVSCMEQCIEQLLRALFTIDETLNLFMRNNIQDITLQLMEHPIDEEFFLAVFSAVKEYRQQPDATNYSIALLKTQEAFEYLIEYLEETMRDILDGDIQSIRFHHNLISLSPRDIEVFENLKSDLNSASRLTHFEYIKTLTEHIENQFRLFLFVSSAVVFSKEKIPEYLNDKSAVSYATRNIGSSETAAVDNIFYGFTRGQYRNVFTRGNEIKNLIVDSIGLNWPGEKWDIFFNIFGDENIVTSHNRTDNISMSNRGRYITYANLAQELIGGLNKPISKLINNYLYIENLSSYDNISDINFRFSFSINPKNKEKVKGQFFEKDGMTFKKDELVASHQITQEAFNRVEKNIKHKLSINNAYIIENLLQVENIQSLYGATFMDFYLSLGYLHHIKKTIEVQPWTGPRIIIKAKN